MSVGAVNKQTGDRIPTAGMPAIDDALDLTSVNPVQNAIITAALGDKQDSTDNNLQTTDKTVVGGINELKNGLTNLADVPVYTTDSALITDFRGKHDYYKTIVMSDSTKTMALLNEVNEEKVYVVLVENQQMWRNHPNFYAFLQDEVWVGILNIGENSVSVSVCNKLVKSSDNNLTTTDKTVVGAINEVRSGLTNVDNATVLNTQDLTTPSRTKNLISANATEMKAMNTDGTWSGDDYTLNGVTFACTFNSDGYLTKVHLSGTASAQAQINLVNSTMGMVPGASYRLNGLHSTGTSSSFRLTYYNTSISVQCYGDGSGSADKEFTFNYASGESVVYIRVFNGYEIPSAGIDVEPQIRLATITDSTYVPYIPSVDARLEAVESGDYKVIASVTGDGVKTVAQLLPDLFSSVPSYTKRCSLIYGKAVLPMAEKTTNNAKFGNVSNYQGTTFFLSVNIQTGTAYLTEVSIASNGTITVTDRSTEVPTTGAVISLVQ